MINTLDSYTPKSAYAAVERFFFSFSFLIKREVKNVIMHLLNQMVFTNYDESLLEKRKLAP